MPNTSDAERTRKLVIDRERLIAVTGRQSEHVRRWVDDLGTDLPSARVKASSAEPVADRMIHRRDRVVVTGLDNPGVNVACDAGRFRLHTARLTIGPARRLRVVHL